MAQVSSPSLRKDAIAGIIVFLIALPLCLGIAQASGAPLFAGIVSGVIGGIVIGSLSKSSLSVSGPAAGLIAIVVGALASLGSFEIFLCSVMVAGLIQLLLGMAKAGGLANYFPSSVIEGMLAGIGVTIIIKEFPNAIGYLKADAAGLSEGEEGFRWADDLSALSNTEPAAMAISIVGITLLALWLTKPFKKISLIPSGLVLVILGTLFNELLQAQGSSWALGTVHLVRLPIPESFSAFLGQFHSPDFSGFLRPQVWITGGVIAAVASIETLLCIEATDKLDPQKRNTSGNAELRAQGIGNILSGLVGGLPITSVIVRSSANINAGATSKRSTIIHGSLLLVCVAAIPALLNHIPKACLSAILIFTGYRLCKPAVIRHLYKEGGWTQVVPYLATVVAVVSLDLLKGVGIGMAIAIFYTLRQNLRIPYYYQRSTFSNGEVIRLELAQEVSFLNKASIKETLSKIPRGSALVLDASKTEYIDFDVMGVIKDFSSTAEVKGIRLSLIGFKDHYDIDTPTSEHEIVASVKQHESEEPVRTEGDSRTLLQELTTSKSDDGQDI